MCKKAMSSGAGAGGGAGSGKKIIGAGAGPKQAGSETLSNRHQTKFDGYRYPATVLKHLLNLTDKKNAFFHSLIFTKPF